MFFYICGFAHILLRVNVRNDDVVAEKKSALFREYE